MLFGSKKAIGADALGSGGRTIPQEISIGYKILIIVIAILYGGVLANLPMDTIVDRENYLNYTKISWNHNYSRRSGSTTA